MLKYDWIKAFAQKNLNEGLFVVILEHLHTNLVNSVKILMLACMLYHVGVICPCLLAPVLLIIDSLFD